jgi:peptide/nickel transport system permease protein
MPVTELISARIGVTMYLSLLSLLLSLVIGVLFGILCAVKRGKLVDSIITLIANICSCLPQFWIGLVLLFAFCIKNQILPSLGFDWPNKIGLWMHIKTIIMPVICLSLGGIASYTRQTRSSMLEAIKQDYVRTARSKGVAEKNVIFKHVLKNGLIPIVTVTGNRLAMMLGGSMFVETVFNIPGLGMLMMKSVNGRDIPTVQALVILLTVVSCIAYIITDIMYVIVDPRISLVSADS